MMISLLDQAVRAANLEEGYKTLHRYPLFLHFAIDGLFKSKRDGVINNARFIQLNLMNNRVKLPDNVLAVNKVGIQVGRRILTAIPDSSISIDPQNKGSFTDPTIPSTDLYQFLQFSSVYYSGGVFPAVDGSIMSPRFKRDSNDQRIMIFDRGNDGAKVYVEIVESGMTPGANTIITQDSYLPIKSYIHYRNARFKFGANSGEAAAAQAEWDDEMEEAIASQSNLTSNSILNSLALRHRTY